MEGKVWTACFFLRLLFGLLDILTDIGLAVHLFLKGEVLWGGLTLLWLGVGLLCALLGVTAGRFRTGDSMSCCKFSLLSLKLYVDVVQGFFLSGPQVVTQLAVFWSGVYTYDFETYWRPGSPSWFWAWLEVGSPAVSFVSLLVTGVRVINEPGPLSRKVSSGANTVLTALYRLFIFSVIMKVAPVAGTCILVFLYILIAICYRCFGDGVSCLATAYFSLFFPVGHSHAVAAKPGFISANIGIPEAERSLINQEGLVRRIQKFSAVQLAVSLVLLVPYFSLLEVWLLPSPHQFSVHPILLNRIFLYATAPVLLLLSMAMFCLYYKTSLDARDAARTWKGLAPGRSLLPPSSSVLVSSAAPVESLATPGETPAVETSPQAPSVAPALSEIGGGGLYPFLPSAPSPEGSVVVLKRTVHLPPGNRKCQHEDCVTCAWLLEGPAFSSTVTNKEYRFMPPVTCTDLNVIYLVTCRRCRKQYVGKTQQSLRERHYGHRREMDTLSTPLGKHFAEVCGLDSWRIQIIDKCNSSELRRREGHWQHELATLAPLGLNVRDELGGGDRTS